jgi:ABC-type phosphate transport system auxiliary subunit
MPALCAALFLGGCGDEPKPADAEDVKREARDLADTLQSYTAEQKDQAVMEAREAMAELNEQIERVRARAAERWSDMDESARQKTEEHLEKLDEEQAQLTDRFEALRSTSGDAWARVRKGFSEAYAELRDAWRETDEALAE